MVPGAYAVFLQPGSLQLPAVTFASQAGDYMCAYVSSAYSGSATVRIVYPGATETVDMPAYVYLGEGNGVSYSVVYYVDGNALNIVPAATGHNYVSMEINVSKELAPSYTHIRGPVIFTNPDPVLRVFLVPEGGKPDVLRFQVLNISKMPPDSLLPIPRVEFAACDIRVSNATARVVQISGKPMVTGEFQIVVNGVPAIVPDIHVVAAGKVFTPQISADDRTYSFMIPYTTGLATVTVTGRIPGCSQLSHEIPVVQSSSGPTWVLVVAVLVAAAIAYYLHKKRKESER